ncbi:hypothetical protein MMC18_004082 [Xylographa bjoerkii]|nr:hypothetical protein [Xylographa bjoerkii]
MTFTSTVQSNGSFHGLPTFPDHDGKTYSAIVAGANGIFGHYMVKVLAQSPQRWKHIYALSRRSPMITPSEGSTVKHIAVDFLASGPDEIARILKQNNVQADYVFFASYVQIPPKKGEGLWSDADEMTRQNKSSSRPEQNIRVCTLVRPSHPEEEDDPRVLIAPNFYYQQEDLLWDYARETGSQWSVTRPGFIVGTVKDAAMNITYPLAVYAAIQ